MRQQVDALRLTPDTRRYVWMWLIPAAMVVAGLLTQTSGLAAYGIGLAAALSLSGSV
jgi:hypothetical protein